ncbi:MAG TPA: NADAR domain-containing protein [Dongiaceae bacterium]|nr:NADAR domain-containing protein [Dongiaceae bacterium]
MSQASQVRTYDPIGSVVFLKTNERFGGLSNMAPGFPLRVNGIRIRTSEALYQACRYPHMPDVQRKIIDEHSPMTAKMRSKPFRQDSRPDWDAVRVKIMRWCLRVKLAQNWREFGRLLLATGDRPIVEQSRKDDFWGAKSNEDGTLVGMNVLGRLLMELREQLKGDQVDSLRFIEPLGISEFLLFSQPIEAVQASPDAEIPGWTHRRPSQADAAPPPPGLQPSLFEQPMISDSKSAVATPPAEAAEGRKAPVRFPQYRESGLPWLSEIPEHWDVLRNGRLFAERVETGFEKLPILEVSLRTGVRVRDMESGARKQQMTDRSKYKRAAKGDIAYNMMRMWQGAVGVAPVDGLISPAYVVARPFPEADPRYYTYLFRTPTYMREVNKFSRGIVLDRNRLYWDEFKQMPSAFPPTEEQARIADFLDAHGRLTARLMRNKRQLIGLLNEQKQATINRAVTRGLNPNTPMKPTGIDWMPEVPAHWDVLKLKRFSRMKSGDSITAESIDQTGTYPVYGGNGLRGYTDRFTHDGTFALIGRQGALCGNVHRVSGTFWASEHAIVTTLEPPHDIDWFVELLRVMNLNQYSESAAQPGLSVDDIANLYAPRPPADEQAEIAQHFRNEFAHLNAVLERTAREITLIREYRERLIADVVTGALDVRHVEIAAPMDEPIADEDDPQDEELESDDAEPMEAVDGDE